MQSNNPVITFSVLPDKYKSDPRNAAGARSEQLGYSDGRPAHRGAVPDEHGGTRGATG